MLNLIKNDPWLEPYSDAINGRHEYFLYKEKQLTKNGRKALADFADGHLYFGLHKTEKNWVLREWAPNATKIYMVGDMNSWAECDPFKMKPTGNGNWELFLPGDTLHKGSKVGIQGRLQTGSYKDKDGKTVYTTDVIADRVEFLDTREKSEELEPEAPPIEQFSYIDEDVPF